MKTHIGNVVLILNRPANGSNPSILMGRKRPSKKSDQKRKRKKVGSGKWVPPGGGTELTDKSQKHAAQREILQETGLFFPLSGFKKVGTLKGYLDRSSAPLWLVHLYMVIADKQASQSTFVPNEEYVDMRWFPLSDLPFADMLPGDRDWIPRLIQGEKLSVKLFFEGQARDLVSKEIRSILALN